MCSGVTIDGLPLTPCWLTFNQLTTLQLYELLALRNEVFIVEQACPYLDIDKADFDALHFLVFDGKMLVGYLRLLAEGSAQAMSFGRLVVKADYRRQGLARWMVKAVLSYLKGNFIKPALTISAQLYLADFYQGFGFTPVGAPYDEDGISHLRMIYQL